tara:strand:+ start:1665 stop:2186 length:522 start_codon:yes stop_codon:yes gene_type:complete
MKTFKQETLIMIDRSYVDFQGCDYFVDFNIDKNGDPIIASLYGEDVINIQLMPTGIQQVIKNILHGEFNRGFSKKTRDHLIEFIKDDLKGKLTIQKQHDEDAYEDIMFDVVLNEEIDNDGEGRMYLKELWNILFEHREVVLRSNENLDLTKYRSVMRRVNKVSDYHMRRGRAQ